MMSFDFDKLSQLSGNPAAFEAERSAMIEEMLASVPEEHQEKCRALQAQLDKARASMPPEKFMGFLGMRIQENLADLQDQLQAVQAIAEKGSNDTPHLNAINKIALTTMKQ